MGVLKTWEAKAGSPSCDQKKSQGSLNFAIYLLANCVTFNNLLNPFKKGNTYQFTNYHENQ